MENRKITGSRVLSNMIWRFAERTGAQIVSFVVTIVLARILDPEAYGIVAIISVFTTILFVFVDSGLANALIQKKDADNIDYSTVFFINIVLCTVLYIGLFFFAPMISSFYNNPEMTALIRVAGITVLLSSIKNVQQAYVSKNLMFKKFFFATLGGTLGSGIIGIWMALTGYGVWALVISGLFNSTIDMIVLWVTVKWRPEKVFSYKRLKALLTFGSRILIANVFQVVYSNLYQLVIGKLYTSADLAYYDKGKTIPNMITGNIDDAINSVILPVLSESQDSKENIKAITKRALKTNMYTMAPLLVGIAAIAEPLIRVLLTEKWLGARIYLEIFCVIQVFRPIATANLSAMKAVGRSDYFLKLEFWKDGLGIGILLLTVRHGVLAIAIGIFVGSMLGQIINAYPSKKLFGYGILEQIVDILPTIILSGIMGTVVYFIKYIGMNDVFTLLLQIVVGIIIYIGGSYVLKMEEFFFELHLISEWIKQKRNAWSRKEA